MSETTARYPHLRRNFALFLLDYIMFGVAYGMVGANSALLPNFISQLTDNKQIIGLAGAMYTFSWLMPQLLLAQLVNRRAKRKPFVLPAPFIRLLMVGVAVVISVFAVDQPGLTLVLFFLGYWLYAAGDSIVTLGWGDMLGSSVPNRLRGTLFGIGQLCVAGGAILASAFARWALGPDGPGWPYNYALVFGMASILFIIGGIGLALTVEEKNNEDHEPGPALREYGAYLSGVLRTDREFRKFVRTRLLFDLATMSVPFYVVFGTNRLGLSSEAIVGDSIILIQGGSALAAVLMAVLSRRSGSRAVIVLAGVFMVIEPSLALLSVLGGGQPALYGTFFVLGAFAAVAVPSYFDWMITHAPPNARPIYIGLTNTISALSNLAPVLGGTLLQLTALPAIGGGARLVPGFADLPIVNVTLYPVVFITSIVLAVLGLLSALSLSEPRHRAAAPATAGVEPELAAAAAE